MTCVALLNVVFKARKLIFKFEFFKMLLVFPMTPIEAETLHSDLFDDALKIVGMIFNETIKQLRKCRLLIHVIENFACLFHTLRICTTESFQREIASMCCTGSFLKIVGMILFDMLIEQ